MIEAALRAEADPPRLLSTPGPMQATVIRGSKTAAKLVLSTIEHQAEPAWIVGMQISPPSDLAATIEAVHDQPPVDPGVIRRNYVVRVDLVDPSSRQNDLEGEASVVFRVGSGEAPPAPVRFLVTIKLKTPLAVVPDTIVLRQADQAPPEPARFQLVWRGTTAPGSLRIVSMPDWVTANIEEPANCRSPAESLLVSINRQPSESMAGEILLSVQLQNEVRVAVPVQFIADGSQ